MLEESQEEQNRGVEEDNCCGGCGRDDDKNGTHTEDVDDVKGGVMS